MHHFLVSLMVCDFLFKNKNLGIKFIRNQADQNWKLDAYCDSDWGNDKDTRRSVTGYVIFMNGNPMSWVSRSQKTVSLATAHAEYNAISEVFREILYIKNIMDFLYMSPTLPVIVHCDNYGAIFLSKNQESRLSKHLDIKTHFIRSYVEQGVIKIVFVKSEGNLADGFTKSTGVESHMRSFAYMDDICSDG